MLYEQRSDMYVFIREPKFSSIGYKVGARFRLSYKYINVRCLFMRCKMFQVKNDLFLYASSTIFLCLDTPAVYTNVARYNTWITNHLEGKGEVLGGSSSNFVCNTFSSLCSPTYTLSFFCRKLQSFCGLG